MKLISLNVQYGKELNSLKRYLAKEIENTDIFCFQEVFNTPSSKKTLEGGYRANVYRELQKALSGYVGYFAPAQDGFDFFNPVDFPVSEGLAIFIKKSIRVDKTGNIFIFRSYNSREPGEDNTLMPRNLQYIQFKKGKSGYMIANVHGLWNGKEKIDTPERLKQSEIIKNFLNKTKGGKILCGDFNLLPDTQSLKILEEGMTNLIKSYKIKTTRSSSYHKPDKFADYTLVSPNVSVKSFAVPKTEVSDHLPMELEFS